MNAVFSQFDNFYVTVKSDRVKEVCKMYASLGWKLIENSPHSRYFNERNLTFSRPHVVEHRDELHLLQVYLDGAIDKIGKLQSNPCPVTTALMVSVGLACLFLIVCGALLSVFWQSTYFITGIVYSSLGGALLILHGVLFIKIYAREKTKSQLKILELSDRLNSICEMGARLTGGADE